MTRKTLFMLACLLSGIYAQAQPYFDWAASFGGTDYDIGNAIATDAQGNVYTTGYFTGTSDFDPGPNNNVLTALGDFDIFITKTDAAGKFLSAQQIAGLENEIGTGLIVDKQGNLYIAGYFKGTVDFDPSPIANFDMTSTGNYDIFICKLSAKGDFTWAIQMGGALDDAAFSIALDATGNIYTTGGFSDVADFNPGSGTFNLTAAGTSAAFISKISPDGNFVWAKNFGGTSDNNWGNAISTDGKGNVYTTGYFDGDADFDPGIVSYTLTSAGNVDVFISVLDSSGNFGWARHFGGVDPDRGYGIKTDASGNVYTTGSFYSTCDFDPGANISTLQSAGDEDIFVSKLDASGNFVWARRLGGGSTDAAYSMDLDAKGNVYTTGFFSDGADFDPGTGTTLFSVSGSNDIFISKLNTSGNFVWARQIGGLGSDNRGRGITVDASLNIHTAGYYTGTLDFNPNPQPFLLTSLGSYDVFAQKMSQCIPTSRSISVSACNSYKSPSGHYTWTSSNTYLDTIVNAGGCDSIITINLTVNKSRSSTISVNACNKFVSPSGKYTWIMPGVYKDTIKTKSGCDSFISITLSIDPLDVSVAQNNNTLSANKLGAGYQWIKCSDGLPVNGQTNRTFTTTVNGDYAVIITFGGCSDTSECYTIGSTNISDLQTSTISLSPNPSNGLVTVTASSVFSNATFRLTDMQGRVIMEKNDLHGNAFSFDFSAQAPGIYFTEFLENGKSRKGLLIKN